MIRENLEWVLWIAAISTVEQTTKTSQGPEPIHGSLSDQDRNVMETQDALTHATEDASHLENEIELEST